MDCHGLCIAHAWFVGVDPQRGKSTPICENTAAWRKPDASLTYQDPGFCQITAHHGLCMHYIWITFDWEWIMHGLSLANSYTAPGSARILRRSHMHGLWFTMHGLCTTYARGTYGPWIYVQGSCTDCALFILLAHTSCMECPWTAHGLFTDLHGSCIPSALIARIIYGLCTRYVWINHGGLRMDFERLRYICKARPSSSSTLRQRPM